MYAYVPFLDFLLIQVTAESLGRVSCVMGLPRWWEWQRTRLPMQET